MAGSSAVVAFEWKESKCAKTLDICRHMGEPTRNRAPVTHVEDVDSPPQTRTVRTGGSENAGAAQRKTREERMQGNGRGGE
eukprot:1640018-Alexandrium_andersonii.AAC.1